MALIGVSEGDCLCKVVSPVYGKDTPRYLHHVKHLVEQKGVEFTVDRQKAIYYSTLQLLGGNGDLARSILTEARVKQRKDRPGVPSGVEGIAVTYVLQATRPQIRRKGLASLRCFTALRLPKPSTKQVSKARKGINTPSNSVHRQTSAERLFRGTDVPAVSCIGERDNGTKIYLSRKVWKPLDCIPSRITEVPLHLDASVLSGMSAYYCGKYSVSSSLKQVPYASAALSSMVCGDVPSSVISLLGDLELRKEAHAFQKVSNHPGYGKVTFLQEGGAKARVVCTPSFWVQTYFQPFHRVLSRCVAWIESDRVSQKHGLSCVLDQNKGAYLLSDWLEKRKRIFSVDLQSATDRFPLSVQLAWLKREGLGQWIKPIEEAAQGQYLVSGLSNSRTKEEYWSYRCGQPMGLYGSFPLFHLTHREILEGLCERNKVPGVAYAVLGDDVLIGDTTLAKAYQDLLQKLDVPLSLTKTLESDSVASFAGFVGIGKYRVDDPVLTIFRPFKFGADFCLKGREVNLLHTLGRDVRSWSSWWSRALDIYGSTRAWRNPDLSSLLPQDQEKVLGDDRVGSRFFGSVSQRVMSEFDQKYPDLQLPDRVMGTWTAERATLFYEQGPRITRNFDPDRYSISERERKRKFSPSYAALGIELDLPFLHNSHVKGSVETER
uniref:Putative replicase n=1 Tax=Mensystermes virus TaxID=2796614 RepID=A0A894KQ31_9VIRU|nr:putative replicase [Mensystermes virus]